MTNMTVSAASPKNISLLSMQNISKAFAGIHALSAASLEVAEGEVHALTVGDSKRDSKHDQQGRKRGAEYLGGGFKHGNTCGWCVMNAL